MNSGNTTSAIENILKAYSEHEFVFVIKRFQSAMIIVLNQIYSFPNRITREINDRMAEFDSVIPYREESLSIVKTVLNDFVILQILK